MESKKFSIEEALKTGWQKTKENFLFLFGVGLVTFVVTTILNSAMEDKGGISILAGIVSVIFSVFVNIGLLKIVLKLLNSEKPNIKTFLEVTFSQFFRYIGTAILYGICVLVGFILLIVPGIIAILRLQFAYYYVVDKGMGPVEALKASWAATKGETFNIFLYTIVVLIMNIIGALIFGLGLIVTLPITFISLGYIYRKLSGTSVPQTTVVEAHPVVQTPAEAPTESKTKEQTPSQQ